MVPVASSTAKQTGTRWGSWSRSTVARRATRASANRRLASVSVTWPPPSAVAVTVLCCHIGSLAGARSRLGGLLEEVDGFVDTVSVSAVAEDGDSECVAVPNRGAGEEDPPALVDLVEDARTVGVVEGDDTQLGFPWQLEVFDL